MKIIITILSWILFALPLPFLVASIIDFIITRDFIDIIIFVFLLIPFSLSCRYLIKRMKQKHANQSDKGGKIQPVKPSQETKALPQGTQILLPEKENNVSKDIPLTSPPQPTKSINAQNTTTALTSNNEITFPDWYVSISFGKSSSNNYIKAIALAKSAPQYLEQNNGGKILHQAIYSEKPNEYLAFIMLYELVGNWKSTFVIINGHFIDRKVVGQLNYCYGDRCRSGNAKFCYGASYMTANPFGCHRLQISACNNPWWSFYHQMGRKWVLDKEAMLQQINSYSTIYSICPMFNYDMIIKVLNSLPASLNDKQYRKLIQENQGNIILRL